MEARDLAVGLSGGRIAIGVVSLLAPGLVGRAMIGPDGRLVTAPLEAEVGFTVRQFEMREAQVVEKSRQHRLSDRQSPCCRVVR